MIVIQHPTARRLACYLGAFALLFAGVGAGAGEPGGDTANRALVAFSEDAFALVSLTPLTTVLAPSDDLPGEAGSVSGFWYELQAADGTAKYRRVIGNPVRRAFEGPAAATTKGKLKSGGVPQRVEAIPASRTFSVLIPIPEAGDELVLFSGPLAIDADAEAATEVGRLALDSGEGGI